MGFPEEFRISVVRTFGTVFDIGESIFWALKKSGQVLFKCRKKVDQLANNPLAKRELLR